jgi:hypothetical protein
MPLPTTFYSSGIQSETIPVFLHRLSRRVIRTQQRKTLYMHVPALCKLYFSVRSGILLSKRFIRVTGRDFVSTSGKNLHKLNVGKNAS